MGNGVARGGSLRPVRHLDVADGGTSGQAGPPGAEGRPSRSRLCHPTAPSQWLGMIVFVLANPRSACVHLITDSNVPGALAGPLLSAGGICCNRQPFPARARLSVGGVVSSS